MTKKKILLSRQDLAALGVSFSNTHLLTLEGIGAFPRRLRISKQRVAWCADEIETWLKSLTEGRKA